MKVSSERRFKWKVLEWSFASVVMFFLLVFVVPLLDASQSEARITEEALEILQQSNVQFERNDSSHVVGVQMPFGRMTDEHLRLVASIQSLESLDMWGSGGFDNRGLHELAALPNLKRLILSEQTVTDDVLVALSSIDTLEELILYESEVTDKGVASLVALQNLKTLSLEGSQVTDSCVDVLSQLPNLQRVILAKTDITEEGVRRLRARVPNCCVLF